MQIEKNILQSIISKYHLGGIIEAVKWEIKQNNLTINFNLPSGEMIGNIIYNEIGIDDTDICINNTSQLIKLLNVINENITVDIIKQGKTNIQLNLSDKQFKVNYVLADSMIIPKTATLNDDIVFNIETELTQDVIGSLIKAKSALPDSEVVVINYDSLSNNLSFEFGGDIDYANKISYKIHEVNTFDNVQELKINFNSSVIKEILSNNKDIDNGKMSLNEDGLMKLEFTKNNLVSTYFLVARSE